MTVTDSSIVIATGDLLTTEFGPEIVILDLRDGVYYSLEATGARIWQLLQTPLAVRSICDVIVAEYDVDPARCGQDVRELVATLAERGLVRIGEQS